MRRLLVILLLMISAGCSKSESRFSVKGQVTFNGAKIPAGTVILTPDFSKGTDGPQGFAELKNSQFDTANHDRPVITGWYIVRVQGFDGVPGPEMPLGTPLFSDYEKSVELAPDKATITIDVPVR